MTSDGSNELFELPPDASGEPFEEVGLGGRANFQSRAPRAGADFKEMAVRRLREAGATIERLRFEIDGFPVDAQVSGRNHQQFLVLERGTPDEQDRGAFRRTDTVMKSGFMAMQLARRQDLPILLITSDLPRRSTKAGHYLASLSEVVWDVVSYRADLRGFQRLRAHLDGPIDADPPAAPWRMLGEIPGTTLFPAPHDDDLEEDDGAAHADDRRRP